MSSLNLSPAQARKLALLSQGVHRSFGSGANGVAKAIEELSYIQIDTISVVERAHHHTLFNRVAAYKHTHLDLLQQKGRIFEYWSHAAAYLPMNDYRFSLPRKKQYLDGERHWRKHDQNMSAKVLERIRQEGPLQARDFERVKGKAAGKNQGWWDWKPAKVALEQLFMEGRLMISKRVGFQKVYDLSERVIPQGIDTSFPSQDEYNRHLIDRYLTANGLAMPAHIAYLRKGMKPAIVELCQQMREKGELVEVQVGQNRYYAGANFTQILNQRLTKSKLKILSPFDNLLIQRQRTLELFGFDYQIECYVPAPKRKFGYFSLPLLLGRDFVGRMDAKIDRKTKILHIKNLNLETTEIDTFIGAALPAIREFLKFHSGETIVVAKISDQTGKLSKVQKNTIKQQLETVNLTG